MIGSDAVRKKKNLNRKGQLVALELLLSPLKTYRSVFSQENASLYLV